MILELLNIGEIDILTDYCDTNQSVLPYSIEYNLLDAHINPEKYSSSSQKHVYINTLYIMNNRTVTHGGWLCSYSGYVSYKISNSGYLYNNYSYTMYHI